MPPTPGSPRTLDRKRLSYFARRTPGPDFVRFGFHKSQGSSCVHAIRFSEIDLQRRVMAVRCVPLGSLLPTITTHRPTPKTITGWQKIA